MMEPMAPAPGMAELQEAAHGDDFDYEAGSPHLRHAAIRSRIVARIRELISEQFARTGTCRVLEVGAGHGAFTDYIAATGADVTVTEMSRPSLELLRRRFGTNPKVQLRYDPDGEAAVTGHDGCQLVLCVSVLHHIPDYLGFVAGVSKRIEPGGAFASFQDPLWYPRRPRLERGVDRACYYAWRLGQGHLSQGFSTLTRRVRGAYDETNPADMAEYQVVRRGVDERRLQDVLERHFTDVEQWRYWSTQAPSLQGLLTPTGFRNTFSLVARKRR